MLIKEQRANNIEQKFIFGKKGLIFLFSIFYSLSTTAQCAMCRASLESEGNKTKVEAVNDGIVFLMAVPYILAAVVGFAIYRMYKRKSSKD